MISRDEILYWLGEDDPVQLEKLWKQADSVRKQTVGDAIHLRGLVELSNICRRNCLYCGIRAGGAKITRYRLSHDEAIDAAAKANQFGYGTVVLQAGEDPLLTCEQIAEWVAEIKKRFPLAVTLSLGEQPESSYRRWKEAGADRYLLRFETSHLALFRAIHPNAPNEPYRDRIKILRLLRSLGYEIGSGIMVGLPGQSLDDLADDLLLFGELDLDMIGTGPFLPHPDTPLGQFALTAETLEPNERRAWAERLGLPETDRQVVNSNLNGFKVIALSRLVCPDANIPTTTAIATNDLRHGRVDGLCRGANVIMPNVTPKQYRALYEIYPHKAASLESAEETHTTALRQIAEANRTAGVGIGSRTRQP